MRTEPNTESRPVTMYVAVIAVILLGGAGILVLWSPWTAPSATLEPVVVGEKPYEANSLFYIAEGKGYFAENGLNVTLKRYPSVTTAFDGVASGEVDLGLASEYVVAQRVLGNQDVTIVSSIDRFESLFLVTRRDRGIENVPDLKGKRIGLTRNAIGEFHLGRFLDLHGMSLQDVTLVQTPPLEQVPALANGSVDALVAGDQLDVLKERYGSGIVIWQLQDHQPGQIVIAGRSDWVTGHPGEVAGLLASLARAERFANENPGEAKVIVRDRLTYSDAYTDEVWAYHRLALTLDRSLLIAMNDEARWMIASSLTNATTVPNLRESIDTTALKRVKPDAVNIV